MKTASSSDAQFVSATKPVALVRGPPQARSRLLDALHVFVLAAFAIAQPAYDRLGQRGAYLIEMGVRSQALLFLMLLVSVAAPAALVLMAQTAAAGGRRSYEAVHGIVLMILSFGVALPVCKRLDLFMPAEIIIVLALGVAVGATWFYFAFHRVRQLVTLAAPGILVFPGVFVFQSSVTGLLLTPEPVRVDRWNPVPVVMLVLDEFCGASLLTPDRNVDADRFPHFARLSREATWFRNATTVHGETRMALPAILSGKYPRNNWSPLPADLPQKLFSILEATGSYDLVAFEPVSNLALSHRESGSAPESGLWRQTAVMLDVLGRVMLFHVIPSGYGERLPKIPPLWFGLRDSRSVNPTSIRGVFRDDWNENRHEQFAHFLRCLEPETDSTLYFMHLMTPHLSWCYLPSGRRYTTDADNVDLLNFNSHSGLIHFWAQDELIVEQAQQRYLVQLEYVDRLIGELTDRLRETGLFDRCLLVVTADHGVSFRTNQPRRQASEDNLADILSVPLFVKRPWQTSGGINDRPVEVVDILPTIADVLGIALRAPLDGWSVFDESRPDRLYKTYCTLDGRQSIDPAVIVDSDVPKTIRRRFGDPRDPNALFRIGPNSELVGQSVERLANIEKSPVEIELMRFGDVLDETPDALVPCFFEGLLRSPAPATIAVAVNGTIRAVTRNYRLNGLRDRWSALVPESSFHPGKNDVRFYAVTGSGPNWQLSPCAVRQPKTTLMSATPDD